MAKIFDSLIIDGDSKMVSKGKPSSLLFACDHLRVETFTASLGFLEFVSEHSLFKKADIILGNKKIQNYRHHNIAKITEATDTDKQILFERALKRHAGLLDHLLAGTLRIWTPLAESHAKIFLLETSSLKRAIIGSSNASADALTGTQEEAVVHFEAGPVYDALALEFDRRIETATAWSIEEIAAWVPGAKL